MRTRNRGNTSKVTLGDVAAVVGVSPITVSRALSKPEKVTPALRERILEVVEEIGYVPDLAARALASRTGNLIGVLTSVLGSSLFPEVMRGIEDRIRATGLRIQYANTRYDPQEEIHQLKQFYGQIPTGILIGGVQIDPKVTALLREAPCPVVQVLDITYPAVDMAIGINNRAAGDVAIRHLLDMGYRRIAFCAPRPDIPVSLRLEIFKIRMEEAGLYDPALVVMEPSANPVASGACLLDRLLAAAPDLDAVLCASDDLALGLLFECQRRGIDVPNQIGLCGFSDIDFAAHSVPSLTSVSTPRYQLGYQAIDMILEAQQGRRKTSTVDLGFQLTARQSTQRRTG